MPISTSPLKPPVTTNNYGMPFFCELEQSPELAAWPMSLYSFNPKVIHKFRHSLGDWDKPTTLDALVIGEGVRLGRQLPCFFR